MKKSTMVILSVVLVWSVASMALGAPTAVSIDLSGLGGSDFELEIDLYDNSGVVGDSWALIDNVTVGSAMDAFEGGTLGSWDGSLNPTSVAVVPGTLLGGGSYVLRIDEDPVFTPTIMFRDYFSPDGNILSFEIEMTASEQAGFFGLDELVVSLLDPTTLDPLVPGLSGFGDVLSVSADGMRYSDEVSLPAVPAPGALLLCLIGLGAMRLRRSSGYGV